MGNVTTTAKESAVKEIIDQLVLKYGSLRKAGEALGFDHQKLSYWRGHAEKQREFIESFETIRKALKIPKSRMWEKLLGDEFGK